MRTGRPGRRTNKQPAIDKSGHLRSEPSGAKLVQVNGDPNRPPSRVSNAVAPEELVQLRIDAHILAALGGKTMNFHQVSHIETNKKQANLKSSKGRPRPFN